MKALSDTEVVAEMPEVASALDQAPHAFLNILCGKGNAFSSHIRSRRIHIVCAEENAVCGAPELEPKVETS